MSGEFSRIDREKLNNPVLHQPLAMGVWDWSKEEGGDLHQATRAICYMTAVANWIILRILDAEAKVC